MAGIAHADAGHASKEEQENYYRVNTDLAIAAAKKARDAGVGQFVFMSSMIIYGRQECIDGHTLPQPENFYGNSKWLADRGIRELGSDIFAAAVLRCPMIYGKGSKGNFPALAKLARTVPVFPKVNNRRSMLYIENLCEFVAQAVLSGEGGVFFPQNGEYSNTGELVRMIGEASGRKVRLSRMLLPAVTIAMHMPIGKVKGLASKAFGSSYYDMRLSRYEGMDYQKVGLKESIVRTEA